MTANIIQQFAAGVASGAIRTIDLTQTLSPETPTLVLPPEFGQCAAFSQEEISRYDERGVAWYWNNFTVSEHTGTHFDAPIHWITGKDLPNNSVDTVAPADFIAPAVVIDISQKAAADPDYLLTVEDIKAWEATHGRIPPRSWVMLRTDWSKRDVDAYTNRREDGAHTPGPSAEAVRFLVDERDAHGLGVETIGTDAGQAHLLDPAYPAHTLFHAAGRYGLQCLENLDLLPPTGSVVVAAPLKIKGGSGSPLRVLALVAD
ncbi:MULTISPECIES: cyclase family protein [Sphingopyxis]|jgi:kynurenine formamidase|uniref:cyclase family protein n=1 Tax=Sphingopyxis TaxID=165697 RepID=UPI00086B230C|nr:MULTISPECIES: cyclase family protein [Sphingopyxis]APW71794.1 cyclase [Sphingopyxis granuli]AVA12517.1 cyclase family protein [Sphingopyxis sp. MG]ODU29738.1 MAG: cyclase [Sphingopyxis sp. SCN 67-31]